MKPAALLVTTGFVFATVVSCDRPPYVRGCDPEAAVMCPQENDPIGRIDGTLIYQGPPPPHSTIAGRESFAAGRVVLLLFAYNNPPPPAGTATTAISVQTVLASQLFQNARTLADGSVFASTPYSFPGIPAAGEYQIRAFYSHVESIPVTEGTEIVSVPSGFQPLFTVRNQPVLGDIGGGAIVSPTDPIPQFDRIVVGNPTGVDARGNTTYALPDEGFVVANVTVFLGQPFRTERPMFHVLTDTMSPPLNMTASTVPIAPTALDANGIPTPGPALIQYAQETGLLPPGSPQLSIPRNYVVTHADTGADLPSFVISTSLLTGSAAPQDECFIASLAGVRCAPDPLTQIGFSESAYDRNQNGTIDITLGATPPFADAHPTLITSSPLAAPTLGHLPWVYPLVILSKLHNPTYAEQALLAQGQAGALSPAQYASLRTVLNQPDTLDVAHGVFPVIMFGSILPNGSATNLLLHPWTRGFTQVEPTVRVGIIPIAVEIHGPDPVHDWWVILPPATPDLIRAATPFLPENYMCWDFDPAWNSDPSLPDEAGVPYGRYSVTIINESGQTWSVPNELETITGAGCNGDGCHAVSQSLVVRMTAAVPPSVLVSCPDPPERGFPTNP